MARDVLQQEELLDRIKATKADLLDALGDLGRIGPTKNITR